MDSTRSYVGWIKRYIFLRDEMYRSQIVLLIYFNMVGNLLPTRIYGFRFSSPVRRRVAEAGQGISARTV